MNITLNGKEYAVRYPINSIRLLERQLGRSVFGIFRDIETGNVSFDLMVSVIWAGIIHSNHALTVEAVSQWLEAVHNIAEIFAGCAREFSEACTSRLGVSDKESEPKKN